MRASVAREQARRGLQPRAGLAQAPSGRDVRVGRDVLYTPHERPDGTWVYRAHPTPKFRPWTRRDEVMV